MKKNRLQQEGYDVSALSDPIYVANHKEGKYVRLTEQLMKEVADGKIKI